MKRIFIRLFCALLFSVLTCAPVSAQATAQINGTVKDQSGAVLPGVEITATQTDTGIARTAVTDETGSYVLPNLAVGPYRLEAGLPGFRTHVQTGIVLQVNSNPIINPTLEVGQVTEQVEVQANAALVETRNVGVGQVIENERILELPLNGRQATDLIVLAGAAVVTPASNPDRNMPGSVAISVAGGLKTGTVYMLDGAMHNDPYNNLNLPLPFPDALQEFKVETGGLSAQYGMYSGATINSVTKSGNNEFHGDLFEFVRNDLFNARNYFATKNSTLKRNQYGGTLGGPIRANRLFFFGGYQGTKVRQDPADNKGFVPTAAMLAGDFTAVTSPACNSGRQIPLRAPFVNGRIDPALFSKPALAIAAKLPQTTDPCGLVTYGIRTLSDESMYVGRIDYQQSNKNTIFGRYMAATYSQPVPYSLDANLLNTVKLGYDNLSQAFALGDTYLFGPNTINSFRLALNRTAINRAGAEFFSAPDVGIKSYSYDPKHMKISVTGGFSTGVSFGPLRTTTYQASDDVSLVRGTHQIAIGGNVAHWRNNLNAEVFSNGVFTFNGQVTGLGLADFLTGNLSQIMETAPNTTYMSQYYFGVYFADAWRLTPRLNFNYGLRWEPRLSQVIRNGIIANFSEQRYAAGQVSKAFVNAPAGFTYPGDDGFPGTNCRDSGICDATGINNRYSNFTPRLGLAWDPKGDGRMSVRASYAMAYDMLTGSFYNTFISPPWSSSIIYAFPPGGLQDPWLGYPGGNPFPRGQIDSNTSFVPAGNYFVVPADAPTTARHSWNLSAQKQISTDWLVTATYLGSQAAHTWGSRELNPAIYIPGGPCTLKGVTYNPCSTAGNRDVRRRLNLQYPNVGGTTLAFLDQYEGGGTQSYHGLIVSVQRRAARGVTVGGNYTYSHCYGDGGASQTGGGGTPGNTYLDPNNRNFDRGNCEGDRRRIFNTTAVAEMPQFANAKLRAVASGWRLAGIYRRSTGAYLTVTSGQDRELSGVQNQRAQQILGSAYGDKSLTNYLNPAAFTLPALGSLGNMSPRNIAGPANWQFDLALSRIFNVHERQRLEVRVEAYNVTNSLRRGDPVTVLTNSIFGQINTSYDPRIMQFALKYIF
jgi:Carboxypeptidase regulatory-like domain